MNRRLFLRSAIAALSGLAIDPEELLWVPKTMITVPALPIHTPNMDAIDRLTLAYIKPHLVDSVFGYRSFHV